MREPERQRLKDLRQALLRLHKALIEWERASYERRGGRATAGELLDAVMHDPRFAWLHPISELIVRIDESLQIDALDGPDVDVPAILAHAARLVTPDEHGSAHARRYREALQAEPDVVLAHRVVRQLTGAVDE